MVKRAAEPAGLDPACYAGHSPRAGLATSAAIAGAQERDIIRRTRHEGVAVARRYIRDGSLFRANAAATLAAGWAADHRSTAITDRGRAVLAILRARELVRELDAVDREYVAPLVADVLVDLRQEPTA